MKIAVTGNIFPVGEGLCYGERIIYYLVRALSKLGHEIFLFSVKGTNVPVCYLKDFIEVPPLSLEKDVYYPVIKEYEKNRGIKFDVYQANYFGAFNERAALDYDYCEMVWVAGSHAKFNVTSPSKILQRDMKKNVKHGGPSTLINYGIPASYEFSAKDKGYAVFLGKIDIGKGVEFAVDIAQKAGLKIVLMGPAYNPYYFTQKIYPKIDNEKVIWLRGVDDTMKSEVFKGAKVFISSNVSSWVEYFGIVNIESLAHGVPIIGFSKISNPSAIENEPLIIDGRHGYILHYEDSINEKDMIIDKGVELVNKINTIDRYECRKHFEQNFTEDLMGRRYDWFYRQIQGGKHIESTEVPF